MTAGDDAPIGSDERDALLAPLAAFPAIVLAVSGGPDSMALMHLVHGWSRQQQRQPGSVVAVTVDHGLRPEAAAEADAVARHAQSLGMAHRTLRWAGPAPATGLQAAARLARYRLLSEIAGERSATLGGSAVIVTAHTADDQAETLIMRLARGSGVDGLSSIPPRSHAPTARSATDDRAWLVIRPLLGIPRRRLLATLAVEAVPFIDDPSNRDRRFERVRVREALDELETLGLTREALLRSVQRLQAAREVLERAADDLEARGVSPVGDIVYRVDRAALSSVPMETAVRLVRRVLLRAGGAARPADLGAVESAVAALLAEPAVSPFTIGGCIVETTRAANEATRGFLCIYREPDRAGGLPRVDLAPGEAVHWDERFRVAVGERHPRRVEVGPLGEDWTQLLAEFPGLARLGLPRAAARGIPAFREAGSLLAVPLLAGLAEALGEADAARRLAGPREPGPGRLGPPLFLTVPLCQRFPEGRGPAGPEYDN